MFFVYYGIKLVLIRANTKLVFILYTYEVSNFISNMDGFQFENQKIVLLLLLLGSNKSSLRAETVV